jgi:hypothetical protein
MTNNTVQVDKKWHVDKTVPLALIVTLLLQTGGLVWWARGLDARVAALEKGDETRISKDVQLNNIAIDLAVLKENVRTTKDDISSMKNGFDMLMQQVLQEKTKR